MTQLSITLRQRQVPVVLPEQLGFGQLFTDHIFEMDYSKEQGWHNHAIKPLETLALHPAAMMLHYGQTIFEGLKAYLTINGEINLFRVDKNLIRMNNSARRLCMPEFDPAVVTHAIKELVRIEKEWMPKNRFESMYIRPLMFSSEAALGVRPANKYKFIVMLSPVGSYYAEGFNAVKILVQEDYVRAIRKGLGECKTAANYAASLLGSELAKQKGYTQVLWLDAVELKYIEEVGTMNIFVRFNDEIATPKLSGGILPGITRMSVLEILQKWGTPANERLISMEEIIERHKAGELVEMFGTGTAAIITAVSELNFRDIKYSVGNGGIGELSRKLFQELCAIQYGEKEDTYGWTFPIQEPVMQEK